MTAKEKVELLEEVHADLEKLSEKIMIANDEWQRDDMTDKLFAAQLQMFECELDIMVKELYDILKD